MPTPLSSRLTAEFVGTFCLVFVGTGAIVVDDVSGGVIGHAGISAAFGLVVFAMIAAVGDVSGAHLNPAVTLGFRAAGRFPGRDVAPYVASQLAGALAASGLLALMFPTHEGLGGTLPSGAVETSLVFEVVLTAILMFVILSVTTGAKEKGITAGIAIGGVVAFAALFGGPISGASMNPARSIGPAFASGQLEALWVYIAGPVVGALIAVFLAARVRGDGS